MATTESAFGLQERAMPWWIPLIEGIALVIIGVLLITNTGATVEALALVLAIYWLISGILELVSIFIDRSAWGLKLLGGIIGIWAGIIILNHPMRGAFVLGLGIVLFLSIQALVLGVINILQAFRGAGWGIGLVGVINIIFGIILLTNAVGGVIVLPWVLAAMAIVGGIATIVLAFRLKTT